MAEVDKRLKSGTKYWTFQCDQLGGPQSAMACAVDGGVWRLDPVDHSDGKAVYVEWAAGKLTYDDLHVTFLKNNATGGLYQLAHDIGVGKNNSNTRFNCSLIFFDSQGPKGGKEQLRINYNNCQVVSYSDNGFASDDHGSAATETLVFRCSQGEVK